MPAPAACACACAEPRRILVAEDNFVNQRLVLKLLEKRGHVVVVAEHGRQALEKLQQGAFDLILMDVQMPELDGVEATRIIRSGVLPGVDAQIPLIALTAHAMAGDDERFLAAGMDGYLTKPITVADLISLVEVRR